MRVSLKFAVFAIFCFMKLSLGADEEDRRKEDVLRLSRNCRSTKVRLDQYQTVDLISNIYPVPNTSVPANITCTAHYMTANPDQGICIENKDIFFSSPTSGAQLRIYTTRFGPEKAFNFNHYEFKTWCTRESLVSIELTSTHSFMDQDADYDFRFRLTNVSRDSIPKDYDMDSFKHCNRSEVLKPGERIEVYSQQYPAQADLPSSCLLTFSTATDEEHVEVCIHVKKVGRNENCQSSLTVSGFNTRFWPTSEVLGCDDTHSMLREKEMCSGSKTLTLTLARTSMAGTGLDFHAEIKVKKHPYWQVIANENSELRGLDFVKAITYFVAVIDSLAGIFAAILTSMFKRPRFFWKSWAESVKVPEKCNAIHYEDTYTADCSKKVDEILEVKSY
ncbi:hypothetical protein BsWGS_13938 [Bradybaena similaris]